MSKYPIFRHYLEDEDDKPYYTMNSLSFYYEDMERKQKLIESLAKSIAGYDIRLTENLEAIEKEVDRRLADWDKQLEGFPDSVEELLSKWSTDGTIDTVIQTALIDEKIEPLTLKLADKVGGQRKLKPEELSDEAMALVTGNGTVNVLSEPQSNSVSAKKLSLPLKKYFIENFDFEYGTLTSNNGSESNSDNRVRTGFIPVLAGDIFENTFENQRYNALFYSNNKTFLTSTGWALGVYIVPNDGFVRLVIKDDYSPIFDPPSFINLIYRYKFNYNEFHKDVYSGLVTDLAEDLSVNEEKNLDIYINEDELFKFTATPDGGQGDFTFVGDEFWVFRKSDGVVGGWGIARRYNIDIRNKTATLLGSFEHNWGHVNSIDYCKATDTLILGNGGGDYSLEGEIYVIPNASNLKNLSQANLNDVAIIIDCAGYELGSKFNVIWGDHNGANYNICYLITNDQGNIRKLILGKGTKQFSYGQFVSGKSNNEFNGTFKILSEYIGTTNPNNKTVIQGADFYNGYLYTGVGHDGRHYWKMKMLPDGTLEKENFHSVYYDSNGDVIPTVATEGICVADEYLFIGLGTTVRVLKR